MLNKLMLLLMLINSGCERFCNNKIVQQNSKQVEILHRLVKSYNQNDLLTYKKYFDDDINMFREHARGNIRFLTGMKEFEQYYSQIFKESKSYIDIIEATEVEPWVIAKLKITQPKKTLEALVGYRFKKNKVLDVMILAEK